MRVERSILREGNVHSAKDWRNVLEPVVARYRGRNLPRRFRADAAFAQPELYRFLEDEGYSYAIRLPGNDVLQREIEPLLTRPVGRPSNAPLVRYADFSYQAQSWNRSRRVVAKVEWHKGELFPRVGFIVTNLTRPAKRVVRFYNQRGTAEQWIKEGKHSVKWTRLSCHDFVDNQVRLHLFVLAYNLGNFLRQLVLPREVRRWTLTTTREKLIKIGAKVVRHARRVTFQLAEVAVPRKLFQAILCADRPVETADTGSRMNTSLNQLSSFGVHGSSVSLRRHFVPPAAHLCGVYITRGPRHAAKVTSGSKTEPILQVSHERAHNPLKS